NTERYAQAEKTFRQITQTEQHNAQGFRFLADALSAQHKYADAVKSYSFSIDRLPDPEVAVQLAKAYNRLGQVEQAEKSLLSAIKKFPDYFDATFELSSFYASQQKWDAAFAVLKLNSPEFHNQRGLLYIQKKEPRNALVEFSKAIDLQPKAAYYNNLGIAYQRLGQLDKAEAAYNHALKLNPDYEECEANLAFLQVEQKRWDEALAHLKKITSRNAKLWQARLALGFALEHLQKKEEALKVYRKLLAEVPPDWSQRQPLENRIRVLTGGGSYN
ncbi:MAG TPA: tetratricopeptide repeat protein, partial [Acidobacteriota bacterium]